MTQTDWQRWRLDALRRQLASLEANTAKLRLIEPKNEKERAIYRREIRTSEACEKDIRSAIRYHAIRNALQPKRSM